ncbi:MAG: pseudouridine synthase [Acidobacteriota bacterium]|nr:pseudouridine synthase [Acidobacteriota bacterium]
MRLPSTARKSSPFRYLAFNKPFNVLSQFTAGSTEAGDAEPRRTLADFIPVPDVYPAGRLDYDSEGLMLLTSDGVFQHRLTDPRFAHPRTYWAQVEGIVTEAAVRALREGVPVQSYRAKAVKALRMDEPELPPREPPIRFRMNIPTSWLELSIAEGRNRQVRRMTAAVGFPTLRLVRVSIGSVSLGTLQPGSWRDLTDFELQALQRTAK